jgi:LysM repeat protein
MRRLAIMTAAGVLALFLLASPPVAAQGGTAYYVIDLVNQLRAEYGLPPYQADASLMAAAQAHSEWAAAQGTHSHTGPGGSTPRDRAIAAGYGGGQQVRVWENIYYGTLATPESAVEWWRNSPIHFQGMTLENYSDIGAGVAYSDYGGFFTLNFGHVVGGPLPEPSSGQSDQASSAAPASIPVEPVELAEPNEDGSVIHTVQYGQTLWDIAMSYDVPLSEILALNRLSEDAVLQPGDKIVVVPSPIQIQQLEEGPVVHVVATGQTLFEIALRYGVDLETILALNGLSQNTIIHPGDELLIKPGPGGENPIVRPPLYHTVEAGQTPIEIALIYGIDLETLFTLNGLTETSLIKPGDRLLIRPGDPTPTPQPSPTQPVTQIAQPVTVPTSAQAATQEVDVTEEPAAGKKPGGRTVLIVVVVGVVLAGVAVMVLGFTMRPDDSGGGTASSGAEE